MASGIKSYLMISTCVKNGTARHPLPHYRYPACICVISGRGRPVSILLWNSNTYPFLRCCNRMRDWLLMLHRSCRLFRGRTSILPLMQALFQWKPCNCNANSSLLILNTLCPEMVKHADFSIHDQSTVLPSVSSHFPRDAVVVQC